MMGGESEAAWRAMLDDLTNRRLRVPLYSPAPSGRAMGSPASRSSWSQYC
jgi:hypothetical protein